MLSVSIKVSVSSLLFKIDLYMKLFLTNLLTDKLSENELTFNWKKTLLSKQEESTIRKQFAAAAAKSLQSCPTLCDPIDGSPPGSPVPGILQARTRLGCHFLLQCMKVKSESEVAQSCLTVSNPMDYRLPVSSIHGIFQARVLEWVAIAFSE